jgi:hypothetical protein
MTDDRILCHYTDWNALYGIVEKAELWASDWRMLNDSREYHYSRAMLDEALGNAAPSPMLANLRRALATIEAGAADGAESIFVVSFSQVRDDLPQWRSYAADGKGVAIGCRFSDLTGLGVALRTVDYNEATQRRELAAKVDELLSARQSKTVRWRAQELVRTCMSHKHPGFSAEHEHRLVSAITKNVTFRPTGNAIVPTRLVPLRRADGTPTAPPAIAEIVLGPAVSRRRSRDLAGAPTRKVRTCDTARDR